MNNYFLYSRAQLFVRLGLLVAAFGCAIFFAAAARADSNNEVLGQHIVTIHDQGRKRVVLTEAATVRDTLDQAGVVLATNDRVEPELDTTYAAEAYTVNIYRSHPVTIVEGMKRERVLTPYRSAPDIAKHAGVAVRDEDILTLTQSTDVLMDGIGTRLTIERATPVTLSLYGARSQVYTQAATVEEFLAEKDITVSTEDTVSVPMRTAISENMTIEIWRDGVQTAASEEAIDFSVQTILDADYPVGQREIKTAGVPGKKSVVYEIVRKDGQEISRTQIQSVVVQEPKAQIEIVGNKPINPLTAAKGAHIFTDSNGVAHRETYYDLPMNVVMGACGGGNYTVRGDGAKVDSEGYILIAANLGNYPRCSIVETSMGLGRVYDTGGFAVRHPHGFDLATDWTKGDGR